MIDLSTPSSVQRFKQRIPVGINTETNNTGIYTSNFSSKPTNYGSNSLLDTAFKYFLSGQNIQLISSASANENIPPRWNSGQQINLSEHEGINGSHTIKNHVGKSRQTLLAEMNKSYGAFGLRIYKQEDGTFTNIVSANKLVSSTIGKNADTVNAWLENDERTLVLNQPFSSSTGLVAYRKGRGNIIKPSKVHFTDGDGVRVVLRKNDSMPYGFNVHTAFPTSKN